uniref:Putative LOV domain-containing protein n=1 Tax=Sargassum integerrimum TaxID=1159339 RepID=A0A126WXR3_9PHAE|nr:putative LOV domain-containing protein [Sargassum integerrimum]
MGAEQSTSSNLLGTPFVPKKQLSVKDVIIVDMLNGPDHSKTLCYCISDPDLHDNPIIFCSDGFSELVGYTREEVEGRNCRFLQGAKTDPGDIVKIRDAIKETQEACLCLINYKKDGSAFHNQFYLVPLFDAGGQLAYFLGIQVEVETPEDAQQQPQNLGWLHTMCLAE